MFEFISRPTVLFDGISSCWGGFARVNIPLDKQPHMVTETFLENDNFQWHYIPSDFAFFALVTWLKIDFISWTKKYHLNF